MTQRHHRGEVLPSGKRRYVVYPRGRTLDETFFIYFFNGSYPRANEQLTPLEVRSNVSVLTTRNNLPGLQCSSRCCTKNNPCSCIQGFPSNCVHDVTKAKINTVGKNEVVPKFATLPSPSSIFQFVRPEGYKLLAEKFFKANFIPPGNLIVRVRASE